MATSTQRLWQELQTKLVLEKYCNIKTFTKTPAKQIQNLDPRSINIIFLDNKKVQYSFIWISFFV